METAAAREINLQDIADRVQKIMVEAAAISGRLDEAVDVLRGGGKEISNGAGVPEPSGLILMIASRLEIIDRIQVDQRAALTRIHNGLREAPPATASNRLGDVNGGTLANKYR